jgi:nitrilase
MIITRNTPATPEALRETMSTTQSMFRVAAVQMASGPNVTANLQEAARLVELAATTGARIVALPEYFAIMGMKDTDKVAARERDGSGPIQDFLAAEARRHKIWIVGGSVPLESSVPDKVRNSAWSTTSWARGSRATTRSTSSASTWARNATPRSAPSSPAARCAPSTLRTEAGISVCYDLRFPSSTARWATST